MTLAVGLLDLAAVGPAQSQRAVLQALLDRVPLAERLGYRRYWVAEHHSPTVAHASPELLLPLLAGLTTVLRVGTAGVLLGYHSPYKVAADFRLLDTLFPGRIDLGVARGQVGQDVAPALLDGRPERTGATAHERRVEALLDALPNRLMRDGPEVWLLGSGRESARIAANQGTAFSAALFLPTAVPPVVLQRYCAEFRPGHRLDGPRASIAVAGACAENHAEARRIVAAHRNPFVVPSVCGSPSECAEQLHVLADRYGVSEVVFVDVALAPAARRAACSLLAEALALRASPLALVS
jgi:luciferase family oxidoreductase group 1